MRSQSATNSNHRVGLRGGSEWFLVLCLFCVGVYEDDEHEHNQVYLCVIDCGLFIWIFSCKVLK